jgi:3-oxoadipate enol-lactonase
MSLVFVHSGVTDAREWDDVRPEFAESEISTPELWGAADRVAAVLASFGDTATLVGTSFGGRVVLETALTAPERVARLVLINANPFGWSDEVAAVGAEEEALFAADRLDDAARLMVRWWLVGPQREPDDVPVALRTRAFELARRTYDVEEAGGGVELDLARVGVPVLVIRGELDWPDVERAAQRFLRELPDAREVVIQGAAHLPTLERPDAVAHSIRQFLG